MAIPKYDELMKPLLEAVSDGNQYTMKSLEKILASKENLTDEELAEMLPSGRQTVFKNRVGWAKTYLKKAGLIDSPARATIVIRPSSRRVDSTDMQSRQPHRSRLLRCSRIRRWMNLPARFLPEDGAMARIERTASRPPGMTTQLFRQR